MKLTTQRLQTLIPLTCICGGVHPRWAAPMEFTTSQIEAPRSSWLEICTQSFLHRVQPKTWSLKRGFRFSLSVAAHGLKWLSTRLRGGVFKRRSLNRSGRSAEWSLLWTSCPNIQVRRMQHGNSDGRCDCQRLPTSFRNNLQLIILHSIFCLFQIIFE